MKPENHRETVVVLTGAGISAESGISTFRDANGLWEGHDVMEVASPYGWRDNPELVLEFYNQRRRNVIEAQPNDGHKALVELEKHFEVEIITQNVDDLHERAGSTNVTHLHGELLKVRSCEHEELVYEHRGDLKWGDCCERGSQLRPHIVWFGEEVPMLSPAAVIASEADYLLVIGTSLVVYPAAGLVNYVPQHIPKYIIDPRVPDVSSIQGIHVIEENASTGVSKVVQELLQRKLAKA